MPEIIKAGGWPIYFLLFLSVIAVAIICERLIVMRRARIVPGNLLPKVVEAYRKQGVSQQLIDAVYKDSPLGRVLAVGLRHHKAPRPVMKEAIEEEGRAVSHDLERFLTTLGTIAAVGPLAGLFGTIVGMIEIFGSQAPTSTNPAQLAHGISIALYNAGLGILIAIPATIFFRHFRGKSEAFVLEMEQQATHLVDVVHGDRAN